jgi:hypothetical protein
MEGLSDENQRGILNKWQTNKYTVGELVKDAFLLKRKRMNPNVQLIWEKVKVNNLPKEDPVLRNFNNRKAIRVSWKRKGKTYSNYYTPESILGLTGVNNPVNKLVKNRLLLTIQEQPMHTPMFRNPVTRNIVFRRNVKFVNMEKRTNKNIAATKIQAAFRGGRERKKTLNNAKRMTALITSKKRNKNLNKDLNKAKRNKNLNNTKRNKVKTAKNANNQARRFS